MISRRDLAFEKLGVVLGLLVGLIACGTINDEITCTINGCVPESERVVIIQGVAGPTGVAGETGSKGDTGDSGVAGEQGVPGIAGIDGVDGQDGKDGQGGQDGQDLSPTPPNPNSIVEFIDPCGPTPNSYDEVLVRLYSGAIAAVYYDHSGKKAFLAILSPGSYVTTDYQACQFTVTADNQIIF